MSYAKWFFTKGLKSYILWILLDILIWIAIYKGWSDIMAAPKGIIIGIVLTMMATTLGIVYHSYTTWKDLK